MADFQQNLWAPWRMEYIDALGGDDDAGCFLCRALQNPGDDAANYVLWRGGHTIVVLNRWPYSSGHVLVAPAAHAAQPEDISDEALLELMQRTRDAKRVLQAALGAQGFNIGINLGRCAGAGLPDHLHLHIVPRWGGDTNFMPVLADAKVIPQSLQVVREQFLAKSAELRLGSPGATR
jgi:ATP adenylyltransferase